MTEQDKFINHLAFQAIQYPDSGLYHGRMGVILSLYGHGKATGNKRLCEFAKDVLQASMEENFTGEVGLENGLAGLGLGFTLLSKAGMFHDDLNDILFEIDHKLMSYDPRRMTDLSFRTGLAGIVYYLDTRLATNQECVSIDSMYIEELRDNMTRHQENGEQSKTLMDSIGRPLWDKKDFLGKEIGIDNGSAYFLIHDSYDKVFSF